MARSGISATAKFVIDKKAPDGCSANWLTAKQKLIAVSNDLLRSCLIIEANSCDGAVRASLLGWADSVAQVPWTDLPRDLLSELDQFSDPALLVLPFPDPCPVAVTDWLPLSVQPAADPAFKPSCIADLLTTEAIRQIKLWVTQQLTFLIDIVNLGSAAVRTSNRPLALGQDCFKPQARGIIWDLRQMDEGIIKPVDLQAPIKSHLNLELLCKELFGYPDQELLSFLFQGVRYKSDLELQIVLLPHLISL